MKTRTRGSGITAGDASGAGLLERGSSERVTRSLVVVGAHGGAGASTLAGFFDSGAVSEVSPAEVRSMAGDASTTPMTTALVVGQGTAKGTRAAVELAGELARSGVRVVVAIVADGGLGEPIAVRSRLRLLRDQVVAVVRVPYVARWRFIEEPANPPERFTAAVNRIRGELGLHDAGGSRSEAGAKSKRSGTRRSKKRKDTQR